MSDIADSNVYCARVYFLCVPMCPVANIRLVFGLETILKTLILLAWVKKGNRNPFCIVVVNCLCLLVDWCCCNNGFFASIRKRVFTSLDETNTLVETHNESRIAKKTTRSKRKKHLDGASFWFSSFLVSFVFDHGPSSSFSLPENVCCSHTSQPAIMQFTSTTATTLLQTLNWNWNVTCNRTKRTKRTAKKLHSRASKYQLIEPLLPVDRQRVDVVGCATLNRRHICIYWLIETTVCASEAQTFVLVAQLRISGTQLKQLRLNGI